MLVGLGPVKIVVSYRWLLWSDRLGLDFFPLFFSSGIISRSLFYNLCCLSNSLGVGFFFYYISSVISLF